MDARSDPAGAPAGDPTSAPRQRWRLVLARTEHAPDLAGRELAEAWDQAIAATGLPLYRPPGAGRVRMAWAAPLPSGMDGERELAEIVLTEMLPVWSVRAALERCLPAGWTLVDLHDVWLGAPALAGRVSGAVYRVVVERDADPAEVASVVAGVLEARELVRTRVKSGTPVAYDLRPLLADVRVVEAGPPVVLRIETRIHPERGAGRPEEVVAELGDRLGRALPVRSIVRERLILGDEET